VDETIQEGSGRHDKGAARIGVPVFHRETGDPSVRRQQTSSSAEQPLDVGFRQQRLAHPIAVHGFVRLRSRRPHGRPAAAVEELELDPRRIDGARHQAPEGVDLANQMSLRGSTHRRIARHVRDRVGRKRAQSNVRTEARGRIGRLASGMTRSDDDDIELALHFPMQKRSKICASTSSGVRRPVTSSNAARAS